MSSAPKECTSSDAEFELAGVPGSTGDVDDDFDWADDDAPAAPAAPAPPAPEAAVAATAAAAAAHPGSVTVKKGPIPFQGPAVSTTAPAAPQASSASGLAASGSAGPAAAAQPPPLAAKHSAVKPGQKAPPVQPLVRNPAAAGPASAQQSSPPVGAGRPAPSLVAPGSSSAVAAAAQSQQPRSQPAPGHAQHVPPAAPTAAAPRPASQHVSAAATASAAPAAAAQAAQASSDTSGWSAAASQPSASTGSAVLAADAAPDDAAASAAQHDSTGAGSNDTGTGGTSSAGPGASSSKGWGGWLAPTGLGGISSKLQQVALGAAKDLQELTASVQQVVAEVVAADDVTEVDRLAEYQARPIRPQQGPGGPPGPDAGPPAPVMASRDSTSQFNPRAGTGAADPDSDQAAAAGSGSSEGVDPEELKRREVLVRLQGRESQLESGLKVIDDQVDALAANAVKALGSLWGGLNTVAKTSWGLTKDITTKVEAAAKEMAKEVAVSLEESAQLVARAERGLESVLGPRVTSGAGSHRSAAEWESTYESCFELFGGTTATEELEELSSECAHICNEARAKLQQQQREQIDAMLTKLVPLFDPTTLQQQQQQQQGQQQGQDAAAAAAAAAVESVDDATHDTLDALYAPVISMCNKGKKKAAQLQDSAPKAIAAAAAAAAATGSTAAAGSAVSSPKEQQSSGDGNGDAGPDAAAAGTSGSDEQQQQQQLVHDALQEVLQGVHSAAVKSLAEVAAGQIMVLLTMGRSIAALPRYGKPLADGITWPADAEAVGGLMRFHVQHMMTDTREVAAAFAAVAASVAEQLPSDSAAGPAGTTGQQAAAGGVGQDTEGSSSDGEGHKAQAEGSPGQQMQQEAQAAAAEVDSDCQLALSHVRDSYGKLLYVVLLASLHRAGKDGASEQQAPTDAGDTAMEQGTEQ